MSSYVYRDNSPNISDLNHQTESTSFWKKATAFGLIALTISVPVMGILGVILFNQGTPTQTIARSDIPPSNCEPPSDMKSYLTLPSMKSPQVASLPYESRLQRPGITGLGDGKIGYQSGPNLRKEHDQHARTVQAIHRLAENYPQIQNAKAKAKGSDTRGFLVVADKRNPDSTRVLLALNPDANRNYERARDCAYSFLSGIDQLTDRELRKKIIETNQLMVSGKILANGTYREKAMLVFEDGDVDYTVEMLSDSIRKKGGDQAVKIFRNEILKKLNRDDDNLTPKEREILSWIAYFPARIVDIPELMRLYAENLRFGFDQMGKCKTFDVIGFAAYAHQELVRIHPFDNGNGRTARLIMNEILKLGGYQAVVFHSDKEYTAAVSKDGRESGYFADYLRKTAIPWTQTQLDPSKPCLTDLNC